MANKRPTRRKTSAGEVSVQDKGQCDKSSAGDARPKRTVFVTNKGGHDYSAARRFGNLHFVSEGFIDPYRVTTMYRHATEALKDSSPKDLILVTGLPVMNGVLSAVFLQKHGCLNYLLFRDGHYLERNLVPQ